MKTMSWNRGLLATMFPRVLRGLRHRGASVAGRPTGRPMTTGAVIEFLSNHKGEEEHPCLTKPSRSC